MRTSADIYHQVRWDPRFDPERFVLGINQRGAAPKRVPLPAFVPGGDIPWHRVLFVEADGEVVWDRAAGVDRVGMSEAGRVRAQRLLPAPFFTARTPYAWDPEAAGWRPADTGPTGAADTGLPAAARLRVLTWNTLWDRYDSDHIDTAARRPLLLAALAAADADIIALQEVEDTLLAMLLKEPWIRAGWTLATDPAPGQDVDDSGLLLLTRLPVREAGRHVLSPHKAVAALTVETATGTLAVAVTHLTSDHSRSGPERRRTELASLAEGLSGVGAPLLLLGDFNDGRDGPEGPAAALGMRDAWTEARGTDDTTPTFDPRVNPLAAVGTLSGEAARLDRVLLRGDGLRVEGARLRGEVPTGEGLFVSDHYAVEAEVQLAGADDVATVDTAPTPRTAVAWIPQDVLDAPGAPDAPDALWSAVGDLRRRYDPQARRWPPHVNLLFGFVPESDFDTAVPLVAEAAAATPAFTARFDGVHTFGHREDATVWLDPAATGPASWHALRRALRQRFPRCGDRAEGWTPHLTLGRTPDPQRLATECADRLGGLRGTSVRIGSLVLLSRRGDGPMEPRVTVELGTGEVRRHPDPATDDPAAGPGTSHDPAEATVRRLTGAFRDGSLHLTGSRRTGCELPGADLDLVLTLPGAVTLTAVRERLTAALPEAVRVREVTGARVPGLRFGTGELDVDLAVVATGRLPAAEAVARRAELGEGAATALSAVSDADAVRAAVGAGHDCHAAFARLARQVKRWARARGLDSAPFGGLPGLAWSVLAARTVASDTTDDERLAHFFGTWAAWDWREPVRLRETEAAGGAHGPHGRVGPHGPARPAAPVTVLTPTAPVRSCTAQVGPGFRDLLVEELYRAWEILAEAVADGVDPWPRLLAPPPLHRRHASWLVLTVEAPGAYEFEETLGRLRGRTRALLTALEEAGVPDAHAWPRPFGTGGTHARYAVGLGRAPSDPAARAGITAIADAWRGGLPGVTAEVVANGALPTLR